jgi:chemotaxis protein CheD
VEQVIVRMADCRVGQVPGLVLATYALGSCIGLAVHDPEAAVGGLLHFMLPDSGIDPVRGRDNPYMFANTGIPMLLAQVIGLGASKRRLVAHAVGGAQMMDCGNIFDIGKRNSLATRKILWKEGVLLTGEVVGGDLSRTLRLEIGSGRLWLQEGGGQREIVPAQAWKGATPWHTAS